MSEICAKLHQLFNTLHLHHFPFDVNAIPRNGIYVLFETGEMAHGVNRIVRVGTHTGKNQLRSRLQQHFIRENKDRSIFRKNIGRALLARDHDPFLELWEIDLTTSAAKREYAARMDFEKRSQVERQVTAYIQANFRFVVFPVDDKDERLTWESRIISNVSLCQECGPSNAWLGLHSPKEKIRQSGLWLVNELYKQPLSDDEFKRLEASV